MSCGFTLFCQLKINLQHPITTVLILSFGSEYVLSTKVISRCTGQRSGDLSIQTSSPFLNPRSFYPTLSSLVPIINNRTFSLFRKSFSLVLFFSSPIFKFWSISIENYTLDIFTSGIFFGSYSSLSPCYFFLFSYSPFGSLNFSFIF